MGEAWYELQGPAQSSGAEETRFVQKHANSRQPSRAVSELGEVHVQAAPLRKWRPHGGGALGRRQRQLGRWRIRKVHRKLPSGADPKMRAIQSRLRSLEVRLGPPIESEFSRRLRERIEAARQRVAAARARGELGPPEEGQACEARRRRLRQALGFR